MLTLGIINRGSPESNRDMTLRVNDATKAYMITDKATLQKHEGQKNASPKRLARNKYELIIHET